MTRKEFLKKAGGGLAGIAAADALGISLARPAPAAKPLRTRVLGRTGIKTTALGFGAARTMEPALVRAALDRGITFFDTGRTYFNGNNERMLGSVLEGVRKEVVVQSKMFVRPGEADFASIDWPAQRKGMAANLEASLRALRTDVIDILLVHEAIDLRVLTHETVTGFLAEAKRQGKIRAHGFSCHDELDLLRAANASRFFDVIMTPYNHKGAYVHSLSGKTNAWNQAAVEKELAEAAANGLAVVVMKTCSGGPYAAPGAASPTLPAAVKWVIDRPFVGVAVVAMANLEEMDADLAAGLE